MRVFRALRDEGKIRHIGPSEVGIRFVLANPTTLRTMRVGTREITSGLEALAELVAGEGADGVRLPLVRMALLSINAPLMAAAETPRTDEEIVAAARHMALALIGSLHVA